MKNVYVLYYIAAILFVIAAVLSFINGSTARGSLALVFALVMVMAGYRNYRKGKIVD